MRKQRLEMRKRCPAPIAHRSNKGGAVPKTCGFLVFHNLLSRRKVRKELSRSAWREEEIPLPVFLPLRTSAGWDSEVNHGGLPTSACDACKRGVTTQRSAQRSLRTFGGHTLLFDHHQGLELEIPLQCIGCSNNPRNVKYSRLATHANFEP